MCLAVPVRITALDGARATVALAGVTREADVSLIDGAQIGDWLLVHAGFAIQKLTPEDAAETLRLLGHAPDA